MKEDSKLSLKTFFKGNLSSMASSDSEDRSHRFFLKKRDTRNSSSSSIANVSSAGSNSASQDDPKHSHVSLRRFINKMKHDSPDHTEKKEKKKHHFLPLHASSDLYRKYTKGKLLGSGASGSVNLVHSKNDTSKVYAVKKFRPKLPNETEADYKVKVNNEFKIGETLDHENLIKTVELIKDSSVFGSVEYYIIMEYCPYDFFNLVMSGLMSLEESSCYFKQIINGTAHLHSMGLAHRDLKLDNCVVNEKGILKLIDFGSAVQFRKPFTPNTSAEDILTANDKQYKLVYSKGIVGSDPYLSPEVFYQGNLDTGENKGYDARKVDVWSIAIIYCCMVLKRFPWKLPKTSDPSFKQYMHNNNRLFKLLPEDSVPLISKMLSPKDTRILIDDVLDHEFTQAIDVCTYTYRAGNHEHNLVTEEELEQIKKEKEVIKKLENTGMA